MGMGFGIIVEGRGMLPNVGLVLFSEATILAMLSEAAAAAADKPSAPLSCSGNVSFNDARRSWKCARDMLPFGVCNDCDRPPGKEP